MKNKSKLATTHSWCMVIIL